MTTGSGWRWTSGSASIAGKVRQVNEDACLDLPATGLWVVADGMGGHRAGDVASRMIVDSLADVRPGERPSDFVDDVEDRLLRVNQALYERSLADEAGGVCGSTVAALLVFGDWIACVWAGDSRIYRRRGERFEQLTRDHSEAQETGGEAAANVITRAVGGTPDLLLDFDVRELADDDAFLLCSDGLYKDVPDADLAQVTALPPREACAAAIERALQGPCSDNVTVVAVRFARDARPEAR